MENKEIAKAQEGNANESIQYRLEQFQKMLNKEPNRLELQPTPDGKAFSLPISYVEMTLDELFFGQWGTENFKWSGIQNEVQGSIELIVTHPITGKEIKRVGAASISIMVDALSKEEKASMTKQQINEHALNPSNKKSNALDMAHPKLKAECFKNAAQSLGKVFGRDINRKHTDVYKPLIHAKIDKDLKLDPSTFKTQQDILKAVALGQITKEKATELALELNLA